MISLPLQFLIQKKYSQKNPSGCFSMQDYNVGGHDPYSMMALGWVKPYIPTDSCEIKIKPFQTNHDLILLTPQLILNS